MIFYRTLTTEDAQNFWNMLIRLDRETSYMMYEPGERVEKSPGLQSLQTDIQNTENGGGLLLAAVDNQAIIGYIWAERGKLNRISHTAYIVAGILQNYRGQGIGTELFRYLDAWAAREKIVRLELTVECINMAARQLYEKSRFEIEGIRKKSMLVDGNYVDEYYMAKLL